MSDDGVHARPASLWRILVADDDDVDRMAVERVLRREEAEVELLTAHDVASALQIARAHDLHCAVIDYRLPDGTALDFLEQLETERKRELPIIVLTGLDDEQTAIRMLELGVQDYLTKDSLAQGGPGNRQLWRAIRHAVERKKVMKLQQQLLHADRLASIGQLAAGVAHEINNPAAYVLGNLEMMEEHVDAFFAAFATIRDIAGSRPDPALKAALDRVLEEHAIDENIDECRDMLAANLYGMEQIQSIIGNLRMFSRMEDEEYEPVQLAEIIEAACKIVHSEIRQSAVLILELESLPTIIGDRGRLVQVFTNLLMNATQAIEQGPAEQNRIELTGHEQGGMISVVIADSGRGIPDRQLSRIFEPFYTTKSRERGTGLGLSLCMDIVRKHSGDIRVTSELGVGTRFEVLIPRDTGLVATRKLRRQTPSMPPIRRARVLVIDDEREIRNTYRRIMQSEHDVVEASNGRTALDILASDQGFDVIFCDLIMPELDGVALYEEIRRRWPALLERVVVCTAGPTTERTRTFLASIDSPRLHKPISRNSLLRAVIRCVGM